MKPAPFDYMTPGTVEEAVSLLQKYESDGVEAKILAGGQSLVPLLNMRMARPEVLIDLRKCSALNYIREEGGVLAIGAMTSKRAVEDSALVKSRQPVLHAATLQIGHRPIRTRGTVGGSMAQADPAAEYPAMALLLGAEMKVVGPDGVRSIPAASFFITYLTTDLSSSEILTEVRIPVLPSGMGWSLQEIARRHGDFAMAGIALTLTLDASGACEDARVVGFGLSATPLRLTAAEECVQGRHPSADLFRDAGSRAAAQIEDPLSDLHASADYRRHLAEVLVQRCLAEAVERAGGRLLI